MDRDEALKLLNTKLEEYRKVSYTELAAKIGKSPVTLSRWRTRNNSPWPVPPEQVSVAVGITELQRLCEWAMFVARNARRLYQRELASWTFFTSSNVTPPSSRRTGTPWISCAPVPA